jgi:hypothetical protein
MLQPVDSSDEPDNVVPIFRASAGCRPGRLDCAGELTLESVQAEFPRWVCWVGIAGLHYARRILTSPPPVVRAEDPTDLRDQIRGWEGNHSPF